MIFSVILDTLAEVFLAAAATRGWGLRLGDNSWVDLILVADSYWLVATPPPMLSEDRRLAKTCGRSRLGDPPRLT